MLSKTSKERKKNKNLRALVDQEWSFWRPIVFGAGISYSDMDTMDDQDLECANIALDIKAEILKKAREEELKKAKSK